MMRRNDQRARSHPAYWAFLLHRLSGLALAAFLPIHFWALGQALQGDAALEGFLRYTDQGLFKFAFQETLLNDRLKDGGEVLDTHVHIGLLLKK